MRVLLDENMDRKLRRWFDMDHAVTAVSERGWSSKRNGELLRVAQEEFDVLVTMDRNLEHQQNLSAFNIGIVLILARSNQRGEVVPIMSEVNRAVRNVKPGTLVKVAARL